MDYQKTKKVFRKINKIPGWFSEEAALLLSLVNVIQIKNNLNGNIFEIGVHYGKSTLLLHHLLLPGENLLVCDIFGDQVKNTSNSGRGEKEIFLANCKKILGNTPIQIFEKFSGKLTVEEIGNSYRIFHVDGGHSYEEAFSDLELAKGALYEYGVIVLDDPFRYEWPGVTEAVIEFLKKSPDFSVLIAGFNKILLVQNEFLPVYAEIFDDATVRSSYGLGFPWAYKKMDFLGKDFRCLFKPTYLQNTSLKVRVHLLLKKLGLK